MKLYHDCIFALGAEYKIIEKAETDELFRHLTIIFPFTGWGRIEWDKVPRRVRINNINEIRSIFIGEECIIFWTDASLSAIKTNINNALKNIVDVTAVSFDTWIVDPEFRCVIEFFHDDEIQIGFAN